MATDQTNPEVQAQFRELIQTLEDLVNERARKDKRDQSIYANNVKFEPNIWDLKIGFGSLIERLNQADIDWHTFVTVPWALAKLFDYYLRAQLVFRERTQGPITVPHGMLPPLPQAPTEEEMRNDPSAVELFETMSKLYKDVFA